MTARILNGKAIADGILEELRTQVDARVAAGRRSPCLAVILVGDDPASEVYVHNKEKACIRAGFRSIAHKVASNFTEKELLALIAQLNDDPNVDGILVQAPLPTHINLNRVIDAIHPDKDVDGFHPYNVGRLATQQPTLQPCTPKGVITLLEHTGVDLTGKEAVVVGASNIVGRPMALELLLKNATVTVCHIHTQDLERHVRRAEVLVVAVGRAKLIPGDWIRDGAIVVDVGITRQENGKLCGDVDFDTAVEHASWITPVPGGVGPMTIATLLQNTFQTYLTHTGQAG